MVIDIDKFKLSMGVMSGRFENKGLLSQESLSLLGWSGDQYPTANELKEIAELYYETVLVALAESLNATIDSLNAVETDVNGLQSSVTNIENQLNI